MREIAVVGGGGGFGLVDEWGKSGDLVILGGLLLMFNAVLWSGWDRGIVDLDCGCHGKSDQATDYAEKITLNFVLFGVILVIAGIVWSRGGILGKRAIR